MKSIIWTTACLRLVFAVGLSLPLLSACQPEGRSVEVTFTLGDVVAIHDEVSVGGLPIRSASRIRDGQVIKTGTTGRARVTLDSGSTVALDGDTAVSVKDGKLLVESGRVFVRSLSRPLEVVFSGATSKLSLSGASIDLRTPDSFQVYCASGELTILAASGQQRVLSGETATLVNKELRVAPERAFEDWTGGLAEPESIAVPGKSAIPHIRAREELTDAGTPLILRSHKVDAKIVGEVSVTKSHTTYFNGSEKSGDAIVRLALPPLAILKSVGVSLGKGAPLTQAAVQIVSGPARQSGQQVRGLEWAGGSWLSGNLGKVEAGGSLELVIEYAEWLPTVSGQAAYRYAMETDLSQGPILDFAIRVDAQETKTPSLSVSAGAEVKRRNVSYRASDVRPQGDFVVEMKPEVVKKDEARLYVERTAVGSKDSYVLVRTEVPQIKQTGVTLAVVIDTSLSIGAAHLETSLAVVDALLESLGPKDSLVLLAADEATRPIGPAKILPVDAALRAKIRKELTGLRVGGASNLSRALEAAADLVDAHGDGEGIVLYIGDGRPSVGEPDAEGISNLLSARPSGAPRVSTVAVGSDPDRWLLSRLSSSLEAYQVRDREEAARAGAAVLAEALTPRLREVTLDLGPHVDRIYPRREQVVVAGSTVSVVGRLRGAAPTSIGLSYRAGGKLVQTKLPAVGVSVPPGAALSQEWARARIAQLAQDGEGIEPAIFLAKEHRLTTPWTSWLLSGPLDTGGTAAFSSRILELQGAQDAVYSRHVDPVVALGSALVEPDSATLQPGGLVEAAEGAMKRLITQAARSVRACRDARAVVNPEVGNSFRIDVSIDAVGVATKIVVRQTSSARRDQALERCIEGVVKSLPYVGIGQPVSVGHELTIFGQRSLRPTQCSEASRVSLPVRREIWRARTPQHAEAYEQASQACELRTWAERQEFLNLMMGFVVDGSERLALAERLYLSGESDAAEYLRSRTLRSAASFAELAALLRILRAGEPDVAFVLEEALKKSRTSEEGLAECRKFLRLAPHNTYARRRLLSYLEALSMDEAAVTTIQTWRAESVADAGLIADAASTLMRLGRKDDGRRTFGELIERAPNDPWTLAFIGDRLRAEGLYDEAGAAYLSLARLLPHEASVTMRQALAHAGAGRIDVATRLLRRVSETGGRNDEGRLSELAAIAEATVLAGARTGKEGEVEAELERRLLRASLPDAQAVVFLQSAPSDRPVRLELLREKGETVAASAELDASGLGLSAARIERGETGTVTLILRRDLVPGPSQPIQAVLSVLTPGNLGTPPLFERRIVSVSADGKPIEIKFTEGKLL